MPRQIAAGEPLAHLTARFLNPKANPPRLAKVWSIGTASGAVSPRAAAFGLAIALAQTNVVSTLLPACFQTSFDALAASQLDHEAWDWLQDLAPPVAWWREWDRCERISAALARLLERHGAGLETVFNVLRSRRALELFASALDGDWNRRRYGLGTVRGETRQRKQGGPR